MSSPMSSAMSNEASNAPSESYRQLDAMLFRPAPGGFVYRAPNPWIFGRADHFLVSEAQKAELLAMMVAPRPALRLAIIFVGLVLWGAGMGASLYALSGHPDPTFGDVLIMVGATLAALFLALHLALRRKLRRIQPILAAATPTTAVITSDEIRAAVNRTTSLRAAIIVVAASAFGCAAQIFSLAIRNARHPLFSDVQSGVSVFMLALCAFMLVRFAIMAIRKARQTQSAA
jgi:hypothetical protein